MLVRWGGNRPRVLVRPSPLSSGMIPGMIPGMTTGHDAGSLPTGKAMVQKDAFKERERSLEERYFHKKDAELRKKLHDQATLGELAVALGEKLEVDDPELLKRIGDLGVTLETGGAFLLAPLVQVAWAEGSVTANEREAVLKAAQVRGIEPGTPAHQQLEQWLQRRPPDELFDSALAAIKAGLSVLDPQEQAERMGRLVAACRQVASASGGVPEWFGMGGSISGREAQMLEEIVGRLRAGQ